MFAAGPPAAPLLNPFRDRLRIGPGRAARARGLPHERFARLALAGALQDVGHLGKQVGPPGRELAQRGYRGTPDAIMFRMLNGG